MVSGATGRNSARHVVLFFCTFDVVTAETRAIEINALGEQTIVRNEPRAKYRDAFERDIPYEEDGEHVDVQDGDDVLLGRAHHEGHNEGHSQEHSHVYHEGHSHERHNQYGDDVLSSAAHPEGRNHEHSHIHHEGHPTTELLAGGKDKPFCEEKEVQHTVCKLLMGKNAEVKKKLEAEIGRVRRLDVGLHAIDELNEHELTNQEHLKVALWNLYFCAKQPEHECNPWKSEALHVKEARIKAKELWSKVFEEEAIEKDDAKMMEHDAEQLGLDPLGTIDEGEGSD